jgi:CRP-like cAMP-binding protein
MPILEFIQNGTLPGQEEKFEKGSCLFTQGETVRDFYLVTKGSVTLSDKFQKMAEQAVAPPAFLLGVTDLLNHHYSFTATTLEETTVIRISRPDLQDALQFNAKLRLYLLKQMGKETRLTNTVFE